MSVNNRAVPNSGCVVFGRIRIIDATIRPNTNRIRIIEVRDVKFVFFSKFELRLLKFELKKNDVQVSRQTNGCRI